jgi:transforming growth factor-beta-induced protein
MKKLGLMLLLAALATSVFARGVPEAPMEQDEQEMTIVDIAVNDGRFDTLVTALGAADLVDTLSGDGPFTVFAPTDEAFEALPAGTLEALLADTDALTDILLYHVVAGSVPAADVTSLTNATTLQGQPVVIGSGSGVMINQASVTQADVMGSNGVIHVVDAVLLPPSGDIVEVASSAGVFNTLVTAVQAAGLVETLQSEGPFTVFAPTDDAFAKLPAGTIPALLEDTDALAEILTYHVVPGRVFSGDVVGLSEAGTVQGQSIDISVMNGSVMLDDASTVTSTDILTTNGVIHVIDTVIMPE